MRTYKLTIAYDGTNYQGWQRQSDTDRTIQGILEETLENCIGYQVQIDGSGRTDAGVHASGQTASVVLPGKVDTALFTEKMNGCLPPDIRILDVELVKNGFHARKSAVGKVYEYRIDTGIKQDVFTRKYSGHFPGEPDLARMREAAGYLTGTHFFAGYTDKKDNRSVRRTIYSIMIRDERKDFLPNLYPQPNDFCSLTNYTPKFRFEFCIVLLLMCIHMKYSSCEISITCAFATYSFVLHLSFIKKTAHYAFSA